MVYFLLKFVHIIGAAVLLGTGAGIAFFMLLAHRTGNPVIIAGVVRIVVIADFLFTATAVVVQPVTGIALASETGYALSEGWIVLSIALYLLHRRLLAAGGLDADPDTQSGRGRGVGARAAAETAITGCSASGLPSAFRRLPPCWGYSGS